MPLRVRVSKNLMLGAEGMVFGDVAFVQHDLLFD